MTMEPLDTDGRFPDPVSCPLHAKALEEIKKIVTETRAEVIGLKDMNGPIAAHEKKIEAVETSNRRAHKRIDVVEADLSNVEQAQNKIILKVGAVLSPLAAAVGGAVGAAIAFFAK